MARLAAASGVGFLPGLNNGSKELRASMLSPKRRKKEFILKQNVNERGPGRQAKVTPIPYLKKIFEYVCMPESVYEHHTRVVPEQVKRGIRSPGTEVRDGCESLCG